MNEKKDKPIAEILQSDEVAEVLQSDRVARVLVHDAPISTPNSKNVKKVSTKKGNEGSIKKDSDLKALFLITEFQSATIETIQKTVEEHTKETMDLLNRIVSNMEKRENKFDRLSAINKDMEARIKALEEKAEQRTTLRAVK